MAVCTKIRKKKRQICIGDLRDRIFVEDRDLTAQLTGVDAVETFSNAVETWCLIETVDGVEFFNEVNVAFDVTHIIYMRFDSAITEQTWLRLENGQRLNILDVQNLDERNEFIKIRATNRGSSTKEAASG